MRYTTISFIEKANLIHLNKYSYDKSIYVRWGEKLYITCPMHGDFAQTPREHLTGRGCNRCGRTKVADKQRTSLDNFIKLANKKHNNKFDYSCSKYTNARTNIQIVCPEHGNFWQTPDTHLRSTYGCLKCSQVALGIQSRDYTENFITKAIKKYKDKFNYAYTVYTTAIAPITITCNRCNNSFNTTPNKHLNSGACSHCDIKGFDFTKPAILYYLSINNGQAYKIGITNYDVTKRYSTEELSRIQVLKTWEYAVGMDAYKAEQYYLKEHKTAKYTGDPLLRAGNTELFNQDVLLLDNSDCTYSLIDNHNL